MSQTTGVVVSSNLVYVSWHFLGSPNFSSLQIWKSAAVNRNMVHRHFSTSPLGSSTLFSLYSVRIVYW